MTTDIANSTDSMPELAATAPSLFARFRRALGPALPGMALDLVDLCSLTMRGGPLASFPIGLALGVWLSLFYPFGFGWRCVIAIASGVYALTPGTEFIPLATILTCLGRFIESAPPSPNAVATDNVPLEDSEGVNPLPIRSHAVGSRAACPECGSTSLRYGQVVQRFVPKGSSIWAKGHEINAFVCLDCGFVGHFVSSEDLDRLRENSE